MRVTRNGGYLHLIPEDYGLLQFQPAQRDPRDFWYRAIPQYQTATNTVSSVGTQCGADAREAGAGSDNGGLRDRRYTEGSALRPLSSILEAWRDGYTESIGELTDVSAADATAYFDQMIANIRDPLGYAVWFVPIVSARVPTG